MNYIVSPSKKFEVGYCVTCEEKKCSEVCDFNCSQVCLVNRND